ncbi:MAG: AAA family ATPase [Dyella sp.]|uniref:AAA family ATPase n=1 Tax=Dyella sp. TaxID=1869338 RepID=UPI003F7DEE2D
MKIIGLHISNFRGIKEVNLQDLGTMVIIAGQNGSGKSCIFDAIRLLKSVYGGYQANEWQQWMGEFQINLSSRSSDFLPIFNDKSRQIIISCDFKLHPDEASFISENAKELLREKIWRSLMPEAYGWGGLRLAAFASQFREKEPEVAARVQAELPHLMHELSQPFIRGVFSINPGDLPRFQESVALPVIFSTFRPQEIGVIDYHGAQRFYGRESVQGINLNLDANEQQRSQSALYNYGQKYSNVKGEMAASFVKEILAERAGVPKKEQVSLSETLKELFENFFPDKEFDGPQPTPQGLLTFPVRGVNGSSHDLDDLSSGEKEILYGYLRIRSSAPRYSIILLDEPELHLNPRLIRGLPRFYRKYLGDELDNQIWLVTHSDSLLREVVGRDNYNVFHMLSQSQVDADEGQLKPLSATEDLDIAITDLVGDLAAYRPGGKVVVVEGGGDSDFDKRVILALFPEIAEQVNMISGTNKARVRGLFSILDRARKQGNVPYEFFSITDKDMEITGDALGENAFSWDVYHIENYFLVPKYIREVMAALSLESPWTDGEVIDELRACAREVVPQMVRHELSEYVNSKMRRALSIRTDPSALDQSLVVYGAAQKSVENIISMLDSDLSQDELAKFEKQLSDRYLLSTNDGTWINIVRGRDVIKRFVSKYGNGVSYEIFRNLLLSRMRDDGYRPPGMSDVLAKILDH